MVYHELPVDTEWPLVSILIPAYQSGSMLICAVESVLRQDYPRIQLIVSDDGTPGFRQEKLLDAVRTCTEKISFRVLHVPENTGTVQNLNRALACADGEWVMLLAADDAMAGLDTVSALLYQVLASGREWLLARTAMCDGELNPSGKTVPTEPELKFLKQADAVELYRKLCYGCFLPSSGVLYRRELLEKMGGFDQRYKLIEDWPLFLKLTRQGLLPEIGQRIDILHREGGVSGKSAGQNRAYQQDLLAVIEQEILTHLKPFSETERRRLRQRAVDKKAVFQYRFCCTAWTEKVLWIVKHPGLLGRKLLNCWEGLD